MEFKYRMTVLDAADINAEAAFWAALLDGTVAGTDSDRWRNVWIDSNWQLGVQLAEDHVQPTWPDTTVPQQLHFDFYVVGVDALPAVTDRILNAGGRILRPAPDRNRPNGCEVYASPAGHPFCVCWMPPEPNDSEG